MSSKGSYPEAWHTSSFRAMGSAMALWLETADRAQAKNAFDQVQALFSTNEQALSRFRPDSELSQLNAGSGEWVVVSDLLWEVLSLALEMAARTGGHFDPTLLNALEQHGYSISFDQLLTQTRTSSPLPTGSFYPGRWSAVALDETRQAVCLPAGVRLDLGGIAKGYTAQQAVELMRAYGPCLVDAGGDLVAGAAPEGHPGWPVAVSAPAMHSHEAPYDLCSFWLADEAVATSGIDYRTWERGGQKAHHLIDPATGAPALTDCLTVTILDGDAVRAEAWATATLIAGSYRGMNALREASLAGLIVSRYGDFLVSPLMHQRLQLPPVYSEATERA